MLVAQSLQYALAQSDGCILDGVVLVNLQIALGVHRQVYHAVLAYLLKHVVEESQTCADVALARSVKIHLHPDVSLLSGSLHLGRALACKQQFGYLGPGDALVAQYQRLTADILGKLTVSLAIADNVRIGYVVLRVVDVLLHQSRVWLAGGRIILREVRVYQYLVECYAFALQSLQYEVVYRPECILWETIGAQSVLIANHHKLEV